MTNASLLAGSLDRSLRHRAFFQAVAQFTEGSREYRTMVAGLLVLRLLDKRPELLPADFVPVEREVDHMDETPVKRALSSLVQAIRDFSSGQRDTRPTWLITYARFLERARYWEPAADTYATAIALLGASGRDGDLLPMCYVRSARCLRQTARLREARELIATGMAVIARQSDAEAQEQRDYWGFRLLVAMAMVGADLLAHSHEWHAAAAAYRGTIDLLRTRALETDDLLICHERAAYCLRQVGQQDDAADHLHSALELANASHDVRWSLYLRIVRAIMTWHRGDLSDAEAELDAIIAAAREARDGDILGRALHERGAIEYERHHIDRALAFVREAAASYPDEHMRRRALTDIAMYLGDLGEVDCAREAHRLLRNATEADGEARTIAGLNLMQIAEQSGDRAEFDRYRAEIASEPMSGRLQVHFHLVVGEGLRKFGDTVAARAAFADGMALAKRYGVYNPLLADAEAMLSPSP
jgi:tetratricopeptide (TPR) repeat protein